VLLEFAAADSRESIEVLVAPAAALDPLFAAHVGVGVGLLHFGHAARAGTKAQAALLCSQLIALIARKLAPGARVVVPRRAGDVRLLDEPPPRATPQADAGPAVFNVNLDAECGQRCVFCPIKTFVDPHDGGDEELDAIAAELREAAARGQRRARLNGIDPLAFSRVLDLVAALRDEGFTHLQVMGSGRRFADETFRREFLRRAPGHVEVVVPLYGVSAAVHERVTGAPGSHDEVLRAIKGLQAELPRHHLGLATVITRQNVDEFAALVRFARTRSLTLSPQLPYPLRQTRHGAYADSAMPESEIVARVLRSLEGADDRDRAMCLAALATTVRHPCVLWRAQRDTGAPVFEAARARPRRPLAGTTATDEHNPRKDGVRNLTTLHVVNAPCPEAARCALLPACAGDHYAVYGELFGLQEFHAVDVWELVTPPVEATRALT
jgi:molybdenum cofactor biosynthesis enzyme MoaA